MNHPPTKRHPDFDDTNSPKRSKFGGDGNPYENLPSSPGRRASNDGNRQNAVSSEEVATDFKDSLQDLTMNNRYEISNLTIIAKESTEHAMAISRVLENHIRTTPPARKLPALYVLDSIVKNVGTPYTIYLGRNLYSTFMDAYTLVDGTTRKNMEAMLKTWKEPIPGSVDSRPVFPAEVTRNIENALIKARTVFVQQQQQQARSQQRTPHNLPQRPGMQNQEVWRNTPTPPQNFQQYLSPQPEPRYAPPQNDPRYGTPTADFQYGNVPALPNNYNAPQSQPYPFYPPPTPQYTSQPQHQPPLPVPPPQPQRSPPPPAAQFPNNLNLAELLKAATSYQNQGPPPHPHPTSNAIAEPQPPVNNFPGLGALLQPTSQFAPPPQTATPPAPAQIYTPPVVHASVARQTLGEIKNDAQLTNASLKQTRPDLLKILYDTQPSQCGTCGRRFAATEAGKARKGRHLDWHFRTNMRMSDSSKRGVTRSWYVDEMEWIKQREVDDADEAPASGPSGNTGGADVGSASSGYDGSGGPGKQEHYIKAPSDAALAHHICPICQEEFKTVWHDGAQDWVWMDAIYKGGKIYHASCIEELAKDRKGTPLPGQLHAGGTGERNSSVKRELPL